MPLTRRLPKRGFVNPFRQEFAVVNIGDLGELPKDSVVDPEFLRREGFVGRKKAEVKILGGGELRVPLVFRLTRFSESAKKKILAAGGRIEGVT